MMKLPASTKESTTLIHEIVHILCAEERYNFTLVMINILCLNQISNRAGVSEYYVAELALSKKANTAPK